MLGASGREGYPRYSLNRFSTGARWPRGGERMELSKGATAGIIAVAVVIVVGIGYFVFFRGPAGAPSGAQADQMRERSRQGVSDPAANRPAGGGGYPGGSGYPGRGGYPGGGYPGRGGYPGG